MKRISTKVLSLLLALVMVLGAVPSVFADLPTNNMLYSMYVDQDGNQLYMDEASYGSNIEAPEIDGYSYVKYYEYRTYIFAKDDTVYRYINGYEDDTVRPEANMTRAEVVQMLYNLFETYFDSYVKNTYGSFSLLEESTEGFNDVTAGSWYYDAVMTLCDMGIIDGYGDGTFIPDNPITRAEYSKIISFVDQLDLENATSTFPDIVGHWAESYINAASEKGWVDGYEDGTFKPDDYIKRVEAVTLANRTMGRDNPTIPSTFINPYSDIDESHWGYGEMMEASDTSI